jgi:hypothetical protein
VFLKINENGGGHFGRSINRTKEENMLKRIMTGALVLLSLYAGPAYGDRGRILTYDTGADVRENSQKAIIVIDMRAKKGYMPGIGLADSPPLRSFVQSMKNTRD